MYPLAPRPSAIRVNQLYDAGRLKLIDLVKNDTFRTLATDTQFKGKVKEDMLIRLLEAFVWKNHGMSTPYQMMKLMSRI